MNVFFQTRGIAILSFFIVYGYKKILDYKERKYAGIEDGRYVYKAAKEFAQGRDIENVHHTLSKCSYFTSKEIETIIENTISSNLKEKSNYESFLCEVNKLIGAEIFKSNGLK